MSAERLTLAMGEQVRRFARALGRARRGDPAGVHQSRVASRRIREILPLVGSPQRTAGDGPHHRRRTAKSVRRVASALGLVRELDVTRGLLLEEAQRHEWPPEVVARIREELDADRRRRHSEFIEALQDVGARTLLRELRRAGPASKPVRAALAQALDARLQKRARALAGSLRELGTLYVPDRLHAVRLAAKKLRYSLETKRDVLRAGVARDIRILTDMQEILGQLHDLQMLQDRLRAVPRPADRAPARRMNADIERECRALHARVVSQAPAWLQLADRVAGG